MIILLQTPGKAVAEPIDLQVRFGMRHRRDLRGSIAVSESVYELDCVDRDPNRSALFRGILSTRISYKSREPTIIS